MSLLGSRLMTLEMLGPVRSYMATKRIVVGRAERARVIRGVHILANALKVTLGPQGRHVVLTRSAGAPTVTNQAALIVKEFELEDKLQNLGAQLVKEVALKTRRAVGDGATTATVLTRVIVREGLKQVGAGVNPMDLKRGIDKAVMALVEALTEAAKPITTSDEIAQVATMSANGDATIGKLVADAMNAVGKGGVITVEDSGSPHSELDVVEGMQFDRGYLSPYFITDRDRDAAILLDPYVLLYAGKLSNAAPIKGILEQVAQAGGSLLIIAQDVEEEALATLVVNNVRAILTTVAVKAPGFGQLAQAMLKDIAILAGGQLIAEEAGLALEKLTLADLGRAGRIEVDKETTTIIRGAGATLDIEVRLKQIRAHINEASSDYDREKLSERLFSLGGGVAVIKIGGTTEIELTERRTRAADALLATRAAVEEGVVAGGGVALLRARQALNDKLKGDNADQDAGIRLVLKAIEAPMRAIVSNAGGDASLVVNAVLAGQGNYGFDAQTHTFGDMLEFGILEPVKVTRMALQNAASMSSLLLTTNVMVSDVPRWVELAQAGSASDALGALANGEHWRAVGVGGVATGAALRRIGWSDAATGAVRGSVGGPIGMAAGAAIGGLAGGSVDKAVEPEGAAYEVRSGDETPPRGADAGAPELPTQAPMPPGPPLNRFLNAQAPDRVGLGQEFGLVVQVATRAAPTAAGTGSAALGDFIGRLTIDVYAPDLLCEKPTLQLDVPSEGDSARIRFAFVASKPGRHEIHVMAWNRSAQVAGLSLEVAVDAMPAEGRGKQAEAELDLREPETGEYTLDISMEKDTRRFRFQLRSDTLVTYPLLFSEPLINEKQVTYDNLISRINAQARNLFHLQPVDQALWLQGLGSGLCEQLIPDALKDALIAKKDQIRYLNILCDNDPTPWELLFVSDPDTGEGEFLAESTIVSRWCYGDRATRVLKRSKPYFVLPGGSPSAAQGELTQLIGLLGGGTTIGSLRDLNALLAAGGFDLLHFAAHNVNLPGVSGGAYVPFGSQRWDIAFMGAVPRNKFRKASPLVFMNSCTSAGTTPLYTELSGWAQRFLLAGSGAFIGTLWEVRDTSARAFAEEVYGRLVDGAKLGAAMQAGRAAIRKNNAGDPTALAYTLYGHALATLQGPSPAQP
jgi:chaperonin GroEL